MSQVTLLRCAALALSALPLRAQSEVRIYNLLHAERERLTAIEKDTNTPADALEAAKARKQRLAAVMYEPDKYRVQVSLAEIVTEGDKPPTLKMSAWRSGAEYIYPGSAIHLCGAVAALEQLNAIKAKQEPAASETTALAFYPVEKNGTLVDKDESNVDGAKITLAHLIRRTLLVSDDDAFNRLYDFCGQQWLNERMWRAGLLSTRISHRLSVDQRPPLQRTKPSIELRLPDHMIMIGAEYSTLNLEPGTNESLFVGKAFIDEKSKERVRGGYSFYKKNGMTLADLQKCLVRVVRPDVALEGEPFDLTDAQRTVLTDALSQYPGDSKNPVYAREKQPDEAHKFFLPGLARVAPKASLRVYDKIGEGFGFTIDNAYIVDTRSNRAFFLAATVWSDSDGVLNDDKYDYESFSRPFLADVAELVARDVWGVAIAK